MGDGEHVRVEEVPRGELGRDGHQPARAEQEPGDGPGEVGAGQAERRWANGRHMAM